MGDLLIAVDMLRGFCEEGYPLYCGQPGRDIIPVVRERVLAYREAGSPVIFLCDNHAEDDPEFELYPPHCIAGTAESEIIPELREFAEQAIVLPKTTLSCLLNTGLEERLAQLRPQRVELVGVCTNICILFAAYELRIRGIAVTVPRAAVTSFDLEAHEWALKQMVDVLRCDIT